MASNTPLSKAVEKAGGQSALGRALGVGQSTVRYWLMRSKKGVPPEFAPKIEAATGIPKHELRPDVFPPPEVAR